MKQVRPIPSISFMFLVLYKNQDTNKNTEHTNKKRRRKGRKGRRKGVKDGGMEEGTERGKERGRKPIGNIWGKKVIQEQKQMDNLARMIRDFTLKKSHLQR